MLPAAFDALTLLRSAPMTSRDHSTIFLLTRNLSRWPEGQQKTQALLRVLFSIVVSKTISSWQAGAPDLGAHADNRLPNCENGRFRNFTCSRAL